MTPNRSCTNATAGLLLVLLMTYNMLPALLYLCVCMYNEYQPYNMQCICHTLCCAFDSLVDELLGQ